jgi:hypothetical protein
MTRAVRTALAVDLPLSALILTAPCANCPFRLDRPGYISPGRGREIVQTLRDGGKFACHKHCTPTDSGDTDLDDPGSMDDRNAPMCGGATLFIEQAFPGGAAANQWVRWMERFGGLTEERLDAGMKAYASIIPRTAKELIDHLKAGYGSR